MYFYSWQKVKTNPWTRINRQSWSLVALNYQETFPTLGMSAEKNTHFNRVKQELQFPPTETSCPSLICTRKGLKIKRSNHSKGGKFSKNTFFFFACLWTSQSWLRNSTCTARENSALFSVCHECNIRPLTSPFVLSSKRTQTLWLAERFPL